MLTLLLSRAACTQCQQCCTFDSYDFRETPVFDAAMRDRILALLPETAFVSVGTGAFRFRIQETDAEGRFPCPLLDPAKGCILGKDKPFVCRFFPFRVMELNGRRVIAVSPFCEPIAALPLGTLRSFLKAELADTVFAYAAAHPDIVQPYDELYPVLLWEPQLF